MRLIDADAIRLPKGFFEKIDNVPKFYDWLDEQPTIEPKRGKWIKNEELSSNHVEPIFLCSNCNNFEAWGFTECYPYCPNCGATMDGGEVDASDL